MKKLNKKPVVLITGYLGSGISDPGAVSASFLAYEEDNPDVKEAWDEEFGDRVNQLVIIGKGYNQKTIREALESCLDQKAIA